MRFPILAAILTFIATPALGIPYGIDIRGECTLKTGSQEAAFPFAFESYAWAFTTERQEIPLKVGDQHLILRVSHNTNPTWHFAGRRFEASRSFGAALIDAKGELVAGRSMQLPYHGFDNQEVAAMLSWDQRNRLTCVGVTKEIPYPLAGCGIRKGLHGSRDIADFERIASRRIDTKSAQDPSVTMVTLADRSFVDCRVDETENFDMLTCIHRNEDTSAIRSVLSAAVGDLHPNRTFTFIDDATGNASYLIRCGAY